MGMIMHDDVPYGEGTSYTQGTGIAINNNVIAVDADNTPTENSEKPVKSKGVYSAVESVEEEIEQIYADNGVLGAKNLFDFNKFIAALSGVIVTNGNPINLTTDTDMTYGSCNYMIDVKENTDYKIVSNVTIAQGHAAIKIQEANTSTQIAISQTISRSGELNVQFNSGNHTQLKVVLFVTWKTVESGNVTYSDLMMILATDPDDTYVPYAMTNRELTEELTVQESAVTDIVSGATVDTNNMGNHLRKVGNIVFLELSLSGVTATAWQEILFKVPNGYKPKNDGFFFRDSSNQTAIKIYQGTAVINTTLSNATLQIQASWITN